MKKNAIILFSLIQAAILIVISAMPATSSTGSTQVRYEVVTRGFNIGRATSSIRVSGDDGEKVVRFANKTDVNASFLWIRFDIHSSEQATIKGGRLISYARREKTGDKDISVTGSREEDRFRFEVIENGVKRSVIAPCSSYDHTSMECPEAVMDFSAGRTKTLRILDTEYMQVVERTYRLAGICDYRINGKEYRCRIVEFKDPHKSCRRWIGVDGDTVIMFRQDGRSSRGPYSVRATAIDQG